MGEEGFAAAPVYWPELETTPYTRRSFLPSGHHSRLRLRS